MEKLSGNELVRLIRSVFPAQPGDSKLGILVDIPHGAETDTPAWSQRRVMAGEWFQELETAVGDLGLEGAALIAYPAVASNNADLPANAYRLSGPLSADVTAAQLPDLGQAVAFEDVFKEYQLFLAPTQYSTTAPLKNAAAAHGFRAATMPGFSPKMIPALRIDYNEVFRRVSIIKEKVDAAQRADVVFNVADGDDCTITFDLRFRQGHLSSGRFPQKGTAGNLPSGETYIVPYEGEKGEKSLTQGILPVQLGDEVVRFVIRENRAVDTEGNGAAAVAEREHLRKEPAYGNMAELGFGVLADFGLTPIDEILLDEKLGFHVAFGRSDHFGGAVGPGDFSSPAGVIHLDRIYIPAVQSRVTVKSIVLALENQDGETNTETIMKNGQYLVF